MKSPILESKEKVTLSKKQIRTYEVNKEIHGKLNTDKFKRKMFNVAVIEVETLNPNMEITNTKSNIS